MKKLEIWRRRARGAAVGESPADAASVVAVSAQPATAERLAALEQAAEGEHQLLRLAALAQHEDTVPAAFYRAPAE